MNPSVRISVALEEAIMRSLAKDPNDRFRSMDEVLAALKRLGPATAPEPSASLSMDRPSSTGSGPVSSRIVRGAGAALAIPSQPGLPGLPGQPAEPSDSQMGGNSTQGDLPPEVLATPIAPPEPARPYRLLAAAAGLLIVAGSVGYAKLHATRVTGSPVPAAEVAAPASPAAAPSAQDPVKPVTEVDFFALSPGTSASAPASAPAKAAPPPPPAATPKPKPGVAPAPVVAAPQQKAAPPAPAAKATSDCNPSYYYDADGNKHFKPECFGR
jgi:serine/threonine-protein kinase